jgi:hypothetical protein
MTVEKFVLTVTIRDAVEGREPEILNALAVQWGGGSTHIHCPYQDHPDNHPSWRWDTAKKRAYCTCTRSDSIFDVICKIKGLDFEAAKIAAAEIIGRPDLICQRRRKMNRGKGPQFPVSETTTPQHSKGCTLASYASTKQLQPEFLHSLGITQISYRGNPALKIPYRDATGAEVAVRFRMALDGSDKFRFRKGDNAQLYGLDRIAAARKGAEITITEGESDCHTLWQEDFDAIGLPGAGSWNEERDAQHFDGFDTIYVVIEPDKGGDVIRKWLAKSKIRGSAKLVACGGFKDPSALHLDDPVRFAERWAAALSAAVPWHDEAEDKTEMEDASKEEAPREQEREKQADVIVRLASLQATLFHAPDSTAFADIRVEDHRETSLLRSRDFKLRLARLY